MVEGLVVVGSGGFTQMCTGDLQRAPQNASVQTYTLRRLSVFPATKTKTKMKDPVLWDSTTAIPFHFLLMAVNSRPQHPTPPLNNQPPPPKKKKNSFAASFLANFFFFLRGFRF